MKKTVSLGILFILLFSLATASFASTNDKAPAAATSEQKAAPSQEKKDINTVNSNVKDASKETIKANPKDINTMAQKIPLDNTKKDLTYYLKHAWVAIVGGIMVGILILMYSMDSWSLKRS